MLRTRTARRLSAVAAPALLAFSLTACSGSDAPTDAPTDASKEEFCDVLEGDGEPIFDEALADASTEEQAEAIKAELDELADAFAEVGTPEDIPDEAREGFEVGLEVLDDVSQDDIQQGLEDDSDFLAAADISAEDQDKSDAFDAWAQDYCG